MGNKKSRKRQSQSVAPGTRVMEELDLDPAQWSVAVGYNKGFLSGSRYTSVYVTHLPSGREKSAEFYSGGKAAARRDAVAVARRLVQELQG